MLRSLCDVEKNMLHSSSLEIKLTTEHLHGDILSSEESDFHPVFSPCVLKSDDISSDAVIVYHC